MEKIVAALKPLFDGLQSQFGGLQSQFEGLRSQVGGLQTRLDDVKSTGQNTAMAVVKLQESVLDIRLNMATERQVAAVNGRFDKFMEDIRNARNERLLSARSIQGHDARLDDHEGRRKRLEDESRS